MTETRKDTNGLFVKAYMHSNLGISIYQIPVRKRKYVDYDLSGILRKYWVVKK